MADPPQMQQTQQVNEPPPPDLLNHGHGEKGANGTAAAPVKQEKHKVCDIILCDLFNCTNLTEICINNYETVVHWSFCVAIFLWF